jgi:glucose/arabinose dehydrogenase
MTGSTLALILVLSACGAGTPTTPTTTAPRPTSTTVVFSPEPSAPAPSGEPPPPPTLEVTEIQRNLEVPWDLAFTPDGRMIVTERPGRVRVFESAEPYAPRLFGLAIPEAYADGEAGAMGVTVDREFDKFPFAYVCVSRDADGPDGPEPWRNELLRLRVAEDSTLTIDGPPLVTGIKAAVNHNGCAVEMDTENHIWMSVGEANTVRNRNLAQDPTSLNGKILRINRDGSIPEDNPIMPGTSAPSAVWSMGHRNPQGIAMRADGLVLAPEHGTDRDDEINAIEPGGNYGYGCYIGFSFVGPAQEQEGEAKDACGPAEDYLEPLWASGMPTLATSNATFLTGSQWGGWEDDLIVSTLKEADLRRFEVSDDGTQIEMVETLFDQEYGRLRATVMGPDGALYITTAKGTSDRIFRVVAGN